jgi:putative transposase
MAELLCGANDRLFCYGQQNGSIRRECLDHLIIFDENSLRRTLRSYFSYYHRWRLHLSLDKDAPALRPVQSIGKITSFPEVVSLHHRYERVA